MKVDELVAAVAALEPADLREFMDKLGSAFSAKAEKVYDKNPEENGLLAQPYADIADLLFEASYAFEQDADPMPKEEPAPSEEPVTVAAAVAKRAPNSQGKTPWGGR